MEPIFTFIGILLGGGILGFIQFLISRSDSKDEKENEVLKKLDEHQEEIQQNHEQTTKELKTIWEFIQEDKALTRRSEILRFNDELIHNRDHTHEYFLDILDQIRDYDEYCASHPDFPNGRTIQATENIKKTYDRLFEKGKFRE